jgi:hypothetical protein
MDVDQIRRLEPKLAKYIDLFHDCFDRKDTRAHLVVRFTNNVVVGPFLFLRSRSSLKMRRRAF